MHGLDLAETYWQPDNITVPLEQQQAPPGWQHTVRYSIRSGRVWGSDGPRISRYSTCTRSSTALYHYPLRSADCPSLLLACAARSTAWPAGIPDGYGLGRWARPSKFTWYVQTARAHSPIQTRLVLPSIVVRQMRINNQPGQAGGGGWWGLVGACHQGLMPYCHGLSYLL